MDAPTAPPAWRYWLIRFWRELPAILGFGSMLAFAALWTYWSLGELFYEGWGTSLFAAAYLIPGAVSLLLLFAALRWPRAGGWLIIIVGAAFTLWWWGADILDGSMTWGRFFAQFPASAITLFIGAMILVAAARLRRNPPPDDLPWWRRNLRYLFAIAMPLIILTGFLVYWVPVLATRQDDGKRDAVIIEGNGVTLMWAPAGPGWNWKQDFGGYPSWDSLALYGVGEPGLDGKRDREDPHATADQMATTGLCAYLSEDGTTLRDEPLHIWRMPTTDEFVRSLHRHDQNAGCTWHGTDGQSDCAIRPDKETPLWAPNQEPIYMWTADEVDADEAWYVNYQGYVASQPKSWGNPRHGYRCVREP